MSVHTQLIEAHGGALVDLMADDAQAAELRAKLPQMTSWDLTSRQMCDLEMLLNGSFSPLRGFLGRVDYESVRDRMRLAGGTLWPIPVTLDVPVELADRLATGSWLALRDPEGVALSALQIEEVWRPDLMLEAEAVFGTIDP